MSLSLSSSAHECVNSQGKNAAHHKLEDHNVAPLQSLGLLKLNTCRFAWCVVVMGVGDEAPPGIVESWTASHREQEESHEQEK